MWHADSLGDLEIHPAANPFAISGSMSTDITYRTPAPMYYKPVDGVNMAEDMFQSRAGRHPLRNKVEENKLVGQRQNK